MQIPEIFNCEAGMWTYRRYYLNKDRAAESDRAVISSFMDGAVASQCAQQIRRLEAQDNLRSELLELKEEIEKEKEGEEGEETEMKLSIGLKLKSSDIHAIAFAFNVSPDKLSKKKARSFLKNSVDCILSNFYCNYAIYRKHHYYSAEQRDGVENLEAITRIIAEFQPVCTER